MRTCALQRTPRGSLAFPLSTQRRPCCDTTYAAHDHTQHRARRLRSSIRQKRMRGHVVDDDDDVTHEPWHACALALSPTIQFSNATGARVPSLSALYSPVHVYCKHACEEFQTTIVPSYRICSSCTSIALFLHRTCTTATRAPGGLAVPPPRATAAFASSAIASTTLVVEAPI